MLVRAVPRLPQATSTVARCRNPILCQPYRLAPTQILQWPEPTTSPTSNIPRRASTSSSSTRWKTRQSRDIFAREAKVAGLKSRAAFKLLEINDKYRLFKRGDTVVDLGYAPGSWSQVAVNRTQPGGRVVGIDVIPAQPPKGVSTLQGDFLSREIREEVGAFVRDPLRGRARGQRAQLSRRDGNESEDGLTEEELEEEGRGLLQRERKLDEAAYLTMDAERKDREGLSQKEMDMAEGRVVDVVLSDMSEPWPQTASSWIRSVSNPYRRMMNTSGMAFRDHAGSMDLCHAALTFCYDTLVTGGHFLCKFYQGSEDHAFEMRLKKLFEKVHRIKPDSSRKESKEAYFACVRRRSGVSRDIVLDEGG
ncbi:2' O-ribose methyltransferase [Vermiconidia calcicola]|uniref:2' O-ribose methyltransferase n=1 Tax=Vermiconidia calcicola TaxID=1690605 RepID=A0ACC3MKH6_9PEZI|nr:2' O-ribose methyltransferase [Vermiconidia calcicola]